MDERNFHRTFGWIKPDGYKWRKEIIKTIKREGLKVELLWEISVTPRQVDTFYPNAQEWLRSLGEKLTASFQRGGIDIEQRFGTDDSLELGKMIKGWLGEYMCSGPTAGLIVSGENAAFRLKDIIGPTDPSLACPSTIMGQFSTDDSILEAALQGRAVRNLMHASDPKRVEWEIEWFLNLTSSSSGS